MKERLLNVLKWFLITLGILFLIQLLIVIGIIVGIRGFSSINFNSNQTKNLKDIQPVINYVENYKQKHGEFPKTIEGVKVKGEYKYELNKDGNCYTITKKSKKGDTTRQYQHCSVEQANSTTNSQSYIEYNN